MPGTSLIYEDIVTCGWVLMIFMAVPFQFAGVVQPGYAAPFPGSKTIDPAPPFEYQSSYEYDLQQPFFYRRDVSPQIPVYDWDPPVIDDGPEWGNAVIVNRCNETFVLSSVGGWRLGGPRNETTGYGAKEELIQHRIAPGENYTEAFRNTYIATDGKPGYNPETDKLDGQGISMKIGWANGSYANNITQFEYARTVEAAAKSDERNLWVDLSLLDCGQSPGFNGTDFTATEADYRRKTEWCPGYQGGMALIFEPSEGANVTCEGFKCQGKCPDMYMFDRTREGEPSKVCTGGFRGNMVLSLCDVHG